MALLWVCSPTQFLCKNPSSVRFPSLNPNLSLRLAAVPSLNLNLSLRLAAVQDTAAEGGDPAVLRKPLVLSPLPVVQSDSEGGGDEVVESSAGDGGSQQQQQGERRRRPKRLKAEEWVDWEDQILEDTVPLVGFVRMILHSGKYDSGDKLIPEHQKTIMERLLPYHPESEKKIGCGIDYITIGFHPEFENSRCLFIIRKDGQTVDFSYWKCIKGLIKKNYPLYADSFILRHFRRHRQAE